LLPRTSLRSSGLQAAPLAQEHQSACSATALELMRQLKATLDPNGILNPGKVL
jgi:FAD/FMN-containing dehydrogenase